jgi:hypothetical protein
MTGGSHLSACRREGEDTALGFNPRRAVGLLQTWAGMVPGAIFYFSFLFFFSFSVFLFPSYLLQKCFNSNQTTFRNFRKINAMI